MFGYFFRYIFIRTLFGFAESSDQRGSDLRGSIIYYNVTDLECRKKWKLIRDSYNRYKRKQKHSTGSAAPAKNSKWQFYERLRFLENISSERQSFTSAIEPDANTYAEDEHEDSLLEATDESVLNTSVMDIEAIPETSTSTPEISLRKSLEKLPKKKIKQRRQDDGFIKFLKERQEKRDSELLLLKSQQPVDDDISTFTKHVEMVLRKLSARSRAMAKTEIFNIVSKYEIEDIDGHSIRPYTSSSYNSFSPISTASSDQQTTSFEFPNVPREPRHSFSNNEFEQSGLHNILNLP